MVAANKSMPAATIIWQLTSKIQVLREEKIARLAIFLGESQ
jgi:hypothetical protein